MKRNYKILLALSALLCSTIVSAQINVGQPALKLESDSVATSWRSEAYPIGNGHMGAMIFGGVASDLIQINEKTLWSGGPGKNINYDGGHNKRKPEQNHETLQLLRRALQDKMTAFSAKDFAYIDNTGKVITKNYADESAKIKEYINLLMGTDSDFGSFQTLGNILVVDPGSAEPYVVVCESNDNNAPSANEGIEKLFDGSNSTKWYANYNVNNFSTNPAYVLWGYNCDKTTNSYSLVSGNDMPVRDPSSWELWGSNTTDNFVKLDSRSGETFSSRHQLRTFTFQNVTGSVSYKYYKLVIFATAGNNSPQLSQIILNVDKAEAPYTNYKRTLDIDNAIATVSYTEDGVDYSREYFMSYPKNVMAMRLTASKPGKLTRTFRITTPQKNNVSITIADNVITMTGNPSDPYPHTAANKLIYAKQVKIMPVGGTMSITEGNRILVENADEIILLMSAATNYVQCMDETFNYFFTQNTQEIVDIVKNRINIASGITYKDLKDEHLQDYKNLYDRLAIDFGNIPVPAKNTRALLIGMKNNTNSPEENRYLEMLYYQYGRYLLIGSSRPGSLPANLQGVWSEDLHTAWNGDYHTNINLQMNYWLAQQTNLSECHIPMIEYVNSLVPRGKKTAQHYYCKQDGGQVRGWVVNHACNVWGNTAPGNYYWGAYFPAAAAWVCQDIWEYYQFNDDKDFLEKNYQTILDAAIFWVDNLWTDERDGSLVANPSYSPEHGPYSLGTSCDQAIITEIFDFVIKASEILNKPSAEINEIKLAKSRLSGPQIGLNGQFLEWKDEITTDTKAGDWQHRHTNQLYWMHPGSQIVAGRSAQDNLYINAMKETLSIRVDKSTGWSMGWKVNFWARLRNQTRAQDMLKYALNYVDVNNPAHTGEGNGGGVFSNLFDVHPDYTFQIDGNFGVTAGMTEMLVQSQGDCIEILPTLPETWKTGSFKGIKARGNFEVNAQWNNGKLQTAEITSKSGNTCVLKCNNISDYTVSEKGGGNVSTTFISNDKISFNTVSGKTYEIK